MSLSSRLSYYYTSSVGGRPPYTPFVRRLENGPKEDGLKGRVCEKERVCVTLVYLNSSRSRYSGPLTGLRIIRVVGERWGNGRVTSSRSSAPIVCTLSEPERGRPRMFQVMIGAPSPSPTLRGRTWGLHGGGSADVDWARAMRWAMAWPFAGRGASSNMSGAGKIPSQLHAVHALVDRNRLGRGWLHNAVQIWLKSREPAELSKAVAALHGPFKQPGSRLESCPSTSKRTSSAAHGAQWASQGPMSSQLRPERA
ncbi:hypothetical protein FIBSPDRAFT_886888 [Athelia psychrophila]|uniref:Uncharacterized protein n=1 Tax=Athelia psychrophila TaxID=1759441 RepID=A0A166QCC3_9AGAM|nr:hypothetical protein FIBSPDRAFT_886888 [Fibularhizoctonia sp. CBS 109695]